MSDSKKTGSHNATKALDYPDKTTGSEVAAKVRKEANKWDEQTRADLFEKGMQIIYGGTGGKKTVRS